MTCRILILSLTLCFGLAAAQEPEAPAPEAPAPEAPAPEAPAPDAQEPDAQTEECEQLYSAREFQDANKKGETAFANLDAEGLDAAYAESKQMLQCIQGEIQGMMAAAFHRLTAMVAFVAGDRDRVLQEFNRARLLYLGYEIEDDVAPEGHPLRLLYEESKTMGEGELQRGIPPADGWLVVDGVRNGARPVSADVFIQVYNMDGTRIETVFLPAGEEMPAWGVESVFAKERLKMPAMVATGASAIATGVLYGMSWKNRRTFDGEMTADVCPSGIVEECLDSYRDRTNLLGWSAVGAGVLTLGFGGVTVYAW